MAGRFRAGDPLRGMAALGVVLYHAATLALIRKGHWPIGPTTQDWANVWGGSLGGLLPGGATGVRVFFVLSGYLITRPFVRSYALGEPVPDLLAYLRNRALRLVPALWVALAVVVLWTGWHHASIGHVARALVFSERWGDGRFDLTLGQAWSLNIEARFYLAVPVAAAALVAARRWAPSTARGRLVLIGALALAAAALELVLTWDAPGASRHAWGQMHHFLFGVVLVALEGAVGWRWLARRLPRLLAAVLFALAALCLIDVTPLVIPAAIAAPVSPGLAFETIEAGSATVLVGVPLLLQAGGGGCWRALDNPVARWVGSRSYGIYLYHFVIFAQLAPLAGGPQSYKKALALNVIAGIPATLAAAELSYRYVERPALRLKHHPAPHSAPARAHRSG